MKFSRYWAMPNSETFSIPVIGDWVKLHLLQSKASVDPFARNRRWATETNDLNPNTAAEHHMDAVSFLQSLVGRQFDLIIFDPPYSPRQVSECYIEVGLKAGMRATQSGRLYAECRKVINQIAAPGAVCLSFGWNSAGMCKGWDVEEIMLVEHGGAHNSTICTKSRLDATAKCI